MQRTVRHRERQEALQEVLQEVIRPAKAVEQHREAVPEQEPEQLQEAVLTHRPARQQEAEPARVHLRIFIQETVPEMEHQQAAVRTIYLHCQSFCQHYPVTATKKDRIVQI